jgi:uncharacterized protein (DUF2141 family)
MIAWLFVAVCRAGDPTVLTIEVDGLRNRVGVVQVALFRTADGYPQHVELAAHTRTVPIELPTTVVTFDDLEPGTWALAVLHDENGNGRLDTTLLGVPKEGIGASRDATRRLGEPRFDDARFEVGASDLQVRVAMKYWL